MAINVETSSVAGSELSYVIQGMEMRLALKDMLNDDTIRLVHTFSRLVSPRVGLALDLDTLAQRLGEIQREIRTDIQSRYRVPSHGCGQEPRLLRIVARLPASSPKELALRAVVEAL